MKLRWPVIAFTGAATCGKSTAAQSLLPASWLGRFSFADPIRQMLKVIGVPDANLYDQAHKTEPMPQFGGKSAREMLQTLGTQWGREMVSQDIWAHAGEIAITRMLDNGVQVLIDDCRFDNEAIVIRRLGGVVIEITRPGVVRGSHASERGVSPQLIDRYLTNDGDPEQFANRVRQVCLVCV